MNVYQRSRHQFQDSDESEDENNKGVSEQCDLSIKVSLNEVQQLLVASPSTASILLGYKALEPAATITVDDMPEITLFLCGSVLLLPRLQEIEAHLTPVVVEKFFACLPALTRVNLLTSSSMSTLSENLIQLHTSACHQGSSPCMPLPIHLGGFEASCLAHCERHSIKATVSILSAALPVLSDERLLQIAGISNEILRCQTDILVGKRALSNRKKRQRGEGYYI